MSSSVHVDNKKKYILILEEGLDDTTLTAEEKNSINFTVSKKTFCLSLHYNGANRYLFVNGTEIIRFKAKDLRTMKKMSRTNKTRHIERYETCKCKCKLDASVCNNKQRWNEDKCRCEFKELIDQGICDKGFI